MSYNYGYIWFIWNYDEEKEFLKFIGVHKNFDDWMEAPRDTAVQEKFHLLGLVPQFGDDI